MFAPLAAALAVMVDALMLTPGPGTVFRPPPTPGRPAGPGSGPVPPAPPVPVVLWWIVDRLIVPTSAHRPPPCPADPPGPPAVAPAPPAPPFPATLSATVVRCASSSDA